MSRSSVRAIARRCRWPPERAAPRVPTVVLRPSGREAIRSVSWQVQRMDLMVESSTVPVVLKRRLSLTVSWYRVAVLCKYFLARILPGPFGACTEPRGQFRRHEREELLELILLDIVDLLSANENLSESWTNVRESTARPLK